MYTVIFRLLRDPVRKKIPEKYRTNIPLFLHDNAPAHRPVLVNDLLVKNNATTLEHSPHCPDMAQADFYLFLRLKSVLQVRIFYNVTESIKNATEELKRLSQNGFQECSQHIYSSWQMCKIE